MAGGDFNKDRLGNSREIFGVYEDQSWAQPIPEETFGKFNICLVSSFDGSNTVPSCRNADAPYNEKQFVVTADGFMVTDNVEAIESKVLPYEFKHSDHNPVYKTFKLK